MARPMPRLFLVRHGETEWSKTGQQTGATDLPLTEHGEKQVKTTALSLVGDGLVIDPKNLCTVQVSPRQRAYRTFQLLFECLGDVPDHIVTDEVQEWDYGEYEGLSTLDLRKISPGWSIWKDGCPGGETVAQMQARVDGIIKKVRKFHNAYLEGTINTRDVVIVAHGVFNRVLIAQWIDFPMSLCNYFVVEPASVAVLGYKHESLAEPALCALNLSAIPPK